MATARTVVGVVVATVDAVGSGAPGSRFLERPTEIGRVRRALRPSPKLPFTVVTAASALATLWAFSWPGGPSMTRFLLLVFGWISLGVYWIFRLVATPVAGGSLRQGWGWWLVSPVIVFVTAGLLFTSAPLRLRIALSWDDMNRFAESVIQDPSGAHPDRVGSFPVGRVEDIEGGMRFLVRGTGFLDPYGFAYSPEGKPPRIGEDTYWHLRGPWYLWEESW